MRLKITKGLNIPMVGASVGDPGPLFINGQQIYPESVALDLQPFDQHRFRLLVKPGDRVKLGQPLAEDKYEPRLRFVSPGSGIVQEYKRGIKRRLLSIPIKLEGVDTHHFPPLHSNSREEILTRLLEGGVFPHLRQRPFDLLADPRREPRAIFIKALETAPFTFPPELQVQGHEEDFATGLEALKKLTKGKVHLVYKEGSTFAPFKDAAVERSTIEGPHPAANPSVHIHLLEPIRSYTEVIWTTDVIGVLAIGHLLNRGVYFTPRIIALAGNGIIDGRRVLIKGRAGFPIRALIEGRLPKDPVRLISGDPLTGNKVGSEDHLGFYDTVFTAIPEREGQQFLHFFRAGADKYSASGAYLSGHLRNRLYDFTTNQHGEERPFVTPEPYDKVMPLHLNTMLLVKAVMGEDYELAEKLGLLEVAPEDFALPTFVDPSKIEMVDIIRRGLNTYSKEVLS